MNKENLVAYSYKFLKEKIIKGEFPPGKKLLMKEMTALLGVGPTPIREALSSLAEKGLVVVKTNCGFYVETATKEQIEDLYKIFEAIECLAIREAIENGDDDWEAGILAALHKLKKIETADESIDVDDWLQRNYLFHKAIIGGCKSPLLLKIREDLYEKFERYCYLSFFKRKGTLSVNYHDHELLAKSCLMKDADIACQLTKKHLQSSLKEVL